MKKSKGERITELRTALKLTQTKFANEIESSLSLLSKVENGQVPATEDLIQKISERWKCPIEWLSEGKGEMKFEKIIKPKVENIYQDTLYQELKETNDYLKRKLDEVTGALTHLISKANLGKHSVLDLAGRVNKSRLSRTLVHK